MPLLHGHHKYIPLTERTKFIGRRWSYFGYVYVYRPDHPHASTSKTMTGYIREHRVVWEEANGRILGQDETVHHINGVKDDNRPENLIALSRSDHGKMHTGRTPSPETRRKLSEATRRAWAEGRMKGAMVNSQESQRRRHEREQST